MGQAKALIKRKNKVNKGVAHASVFKALEKARSTMNGQAQSYFQCPICKGKAFAYRREFNINHDFIGRCETRGCFEIWE